MGKKDKRKKGDGGREPGWAWLADVRPRAESEAASGVESAPATSRSSAAPDEGDGAFLDTPLPPLPPVHLDAPVSEEADAPVTGGFAGRAFDDGVEEAFVDIAPVGPTEVAMPPESVAPSTKTAGAPPAAPSSPASVDHLAAQIRDLEARLDEMIANGAREPAGRGARAPSPAEGARTGAATARELLPQEYYLRQWGRLGRRQRAEEVDEFGHDPKYEARFIPFFDFLYRVYFRVEAQGTANIPAEGRCLVVANHSGGPLPYDGIMLRTTVRREHAAEGAPRELRWLAEDFVYHLPFVGTAMNRLGAVRACQENAERLLAQDHLVAVFPEGAKGIGKLFRERYRLQRFGRGGFIRLCLRTGTPIVPAAIVGAEEANPMLYRVEYMTKALGIPYLPITPTFPALGPVGLLPAPTKWKVRFGEPMRFDSYGPEAADDDILVGRLAERVRGTIQSMLDETLAGRQSIWFG